MKQKRRRNLLSEVERLLSAIGKYMGLYSTLMKLVQLAPIALALAALLFSPSAWLSGTLRQWAVAGMVLGSLLGMVTFALAGRRQESKQGLAALMLGAFLLFGGLLRLHLALADVAFVEGRPLFRSLQDFFLGSDLGELLYNALAAFWFALVLYAATLGLAVYAQWRRERQLAAARTDAREGWQEVRTALESASKGVEVLLETVLALREENRALKEELAAKEVLLEQLREQPARAPAGGAGQP